MLSESVGSIKLFLHSSPVGGLRLVLGFCFGGLTALVLHAAGLGNCSLQLHCT